MMLILIDLEATCWDNQTEPDLRARQRQETEVIELGAVHVHPTDFTIVSEFQQFVRPKKHPVLSEFCTKLTGITQRNVDEAEPFETCWKAFTGWLGQDTSHIVMGSWGAFDHKQLVKQCNDLNLPSPNWTHRNIKAEFAKWARAQGVKRNRMGLAKAVAHLGLPFQGTAHRALEDARNVVPIVHALDRHARSTQNTRASA